MRARRSRLSVPGSSERMLGKAVGLAADEIVVDLEDSVAPDAKDHARELLAAFLSRAQSLTALVAVRINSVTTPWGERDIAELVGRAWRRLDSLVVPKVEHPKQITEVERLLNKQGEVASAVGLQALIETAASHPQTPRPQPHS